MCKLASQATNGALYIILRLSYPPIPYLFGVLRMSHVHMNIKPVIPPGHSVCARHMNLSGFDDFKIELSPVAGQQAHG